MKNLLIILSLMCLLSCNHNEHRISEDLQKQQWNVNGWLGAEKMEFKSGKSKDNWQTTFLPNGRMVMSTLIPEGESQFDAHGCEALPGAVHSDSCFTYEVKNTIIKISSHGHGPKDDTYFYKINPEKETGFNLEAVTEKYLNK